MFLIGEFSKIGRISTRMLRHYDEIGLFKPQHIEQETGYRYYSAAQLPQLNRILALKDLGLTLEQIRGLINNNISAEELHGMLLMKKAQVEQTLQEEARRMRSIEERIWEIETEGILSDDNVILKSMPEQKYLSTRQVVPTVADGFRLMYDIHRLLPQSTNDNLLGHFGLIFHSEGFTTENVDVEMGFFVDHAFFQQLTLPNGQELKIRTVPAVEHMATLARVGIYNDSVGHYGALGTWIERHDYKIAGAGWEVFIEPFVPGKEHEAVLEIRLPIQKQTHKEE